jgi:pectate lyase
MTQFKIHIAFIIFFFSVTSSLAQEPGSEMTGYASVEGEGYVTTTGGAGGDTITVYSLNELRTYAKSREKNTVPAVLIIKGLLETSPSEVITFKHGANLSILGEGAELIGVGIRIWNYHNVIIQNLKIREVFYPDDALSVEECQHVWIDHNELHSKIGPGIGVDTYDGLLDIKKGSRYVTVSWNHLHHHMKCMLIGHTDNASQGEIDREMRITIHHNIFEYTNGRNPSLRWGAAHIFNNYYGNIDDYAIALRQGAHGLIENNVFHNVQTSISTNKFTGEGFACVSGNVYSGTSLESNNSITQTNCDFWNDLPYTYQLDATDSLETLLRTFAGIQASDSTSEEPDTSQVNSIHFATVDHLKLRCYPNPIVDNEFSISFTTKKEEKIQLTLYDLTGREIVNKQLTCSTGKNMVMMEKGTMEPGIYLIRIVGSYSGSASIRMLVR